MRSRRKERIFSKTIVSDEDVYVFLQYQASRQNYAPNDAIANALANRFVTFQECAGLQWFESWGTKKLSEVGLPMVTPNHIIKDWRVASDGQGSYLEKHEGAFPMSGLITLRDIISRLVHEPRGYFGFEMLSGRIILLECSFGTTTIKVVSCKKLHWFVFARPSGKRCFVVSKKDPSYSILDCIFHEVDQTYYVIDMVCWRDYPLSDCTAEFRFFWLTSKLAETGAFDPPSYYHKYRFSLVPVYSCDSSGLYAAYSAPVPYVKDGLLFYNKHSHYQAGITPLALVWKDENCSQYVLDTDSKGQVPNQQQVVLELQEDGKLTTSDDPPVVFGCLDGSFIQQSGLHSGCLLRFSIGEGGFVLMDGKLEKADLHYLGKANRARASADSFSKVMFQHSVRHSPLRIEGLLESVGLPVDQESKACDVEMDG
ncbi:hypothetical protein JHK87_015456 [Glycine soja]|nr:hypothetical protein JHK87_015456 [Glycine soja]